jgi:hypothetical protein
MADKGSPKKFDTNITLAIIGLLSAVIVAAISNADKLANAFRPEPTATIISTAALPPTFEVPTATIPPTVNPTDTVPAGEPSSTPAPATDTPTPTPAPIALGEDWPQNCISTLWQPYPVIDTFPLGNGCLQQPIYFFETDNGRLNFQDDSKNSPSQVYGIFAPLPGSNGTVTVKVSLRELTKADLLMGVYDNQDLNTNGVLIAIPAGDVKRQKILQMLSYNNYKTEDNTAPINQMDGYTITFTYTATSVTASVPGVYSFKKATVSGNPKYIFLGYRKRGPVYSADGTFISLKADQ